MKVIGLFLMFISYAALSLGNGFRMDTFLMGLFGFILAFPELISFIFKRIFKIKD
jgi:hypothetical protein